MSISLLAIVTGLIVSGFLIFHFLKIRVTSVTTNSLKALFKEGFPLALFGVVGYIFFTSDQLFIKHFLGVESLGYYSFATRIIYTLILVPTMLTSVIFPIFARKLAEKVNVRKIFNNVTGGLAILGAIFAIIILFGNNLFLFVAPQYEASLPVLTVLGGLLVVLFPSIWLDYVLIAVRKQKQNFLITLSAAILNIFLNFIFIPYFGIIGAAYATILSQLFNVAMTYCYASLILKRQNAIEAQPITTVNL
jgi:O-antigen/teichoic acid export membrane protein